MPNLNNAGGEQAPEKARSLDWFASMNRELPQYFKAILIFSLVSNLLLLVAPLYMLQIYDRVLTSGSTDTLIWLTIIAVFLLAIYGATEVAKRRLCALAAEELEENVSERIFAEFDETPDSGKHLPQRLMILGKVRSFFQNQTLLPFLDIPFVPLFLILLFLIHPVIGALSLVGGAILLGLAIYAEFNARDVNKKANSVVAKAFELASGLGRQRSAMVAMGLSENALQSWRETKTAARTLNLEAGAREGKFAAAARSGRQMLQILILGSGAALAIAQEISPGTIVASSIIMARALAPIDQIVGSWRAVTQARSAWWELEPTIQREEAGEFTPLPRPDAHLALERLAVSAPGADAALINPFGIELSEGQMVALVGGNGSGKTTLLQTIAGVWQPRSGTVSLGNRDVHDWPNVDRGQYVGYVPQNIELLGGTIAQNIARMAKEPDADHVIEAAKLAGAHDMILALSHGYETLVGGNASDALSAGQRQLIGLARAMFGNPVLLLLDEPTANLDEKSSAMAIGNLRKASEEGAIVMVATHDLNLIANANNVLAIKKSTVSIAKAEDFVAMVEERRKANPAKTLGVVK